MKHTEIKIKSIIIYTIIVFVLVVCADIIMSPKRIIQCKILPKKLNSLTYTQKIAPQRLYINVWRIVRNEYADKTMNNQNWYKWRNRYLKYIKTDEDAYMAINTMLSSLNDPYTKFFPPEMFFKQEEIMDSTVSGIGVIVDKTNNGLVVKSVINNSSAQKNDIRINDIIIKINNNDVLSNSLEDILKSKDFIENKTINLTITRNNKILNKKIIKSKIPIETMKYEITKDNIAIVTIRTIMGTKAVNNFADILEKTNNTNAMIIDLRDNYGGILSNAIEMSNKMLNNEIIVILESKNNKIQIYSDNENKFKNKPIILLVNKHTASAAEILAGTLKENLNAVLIGDYTYGKNAIQQVIPLHNNTGLLITSAKYLLPSGKDIHIKGITPDIYMNSKKYTNKEVKEAAVKLAKKIVKKKK